MKIFKKAFILLVCVVTTLSLWKYYYLHSPAWSWETPEPRTISGDYQLTAFYSNKQVYHVNEDIVLTWEIKKISDIEKSNPYGFCPCHSLYLINQFGQKSGPGRLSGCDTLCADLKPGESWGGTITFNLRNYRNNSPFYKYLGEHKIYLKLSTLFSNPIDITVIR